MQSPPRPPHTEELTTPSSVPGGRYKGVVMQQNGHWGAQIYQSHSRVWLGTFKSERAAARAYDSAAVKLHRSDASSRNFPITEVTIHEPAFQSRFTTESVLEMIKDGTYEAKLADYARAAQFPMSLAPPSCPDGVICREMFQKELTPSDVGKLNRLVIPKKHATRFLPPVSSNSAEEELLLEFRDRGNRAWVFRYCYWKSSQSYVFTKGWNKFVKENRLRAKDTVGFYRCQEREGLRRTYCMIDIVRRCALAVEAGEEDEEQEEEEEEEEEEEDEDQSAERKEMKLFGVWIK